MRNTRNTLQQLGVLTSLEAARALLLDLSHPVAPLLQPIDKAQGCICAAPLIATLHPQQAFALRDGWAMKADETIGASSYAPVMPLTAPIAVETGDGLGPDRDCIVDQYGVDFSGPIIQVMAESAPGANVRRPGEDARAGQVLLAQGHRLRATDIACAAQLGLTHIAVRQPRVVIIDIPARDGATTTLQFLLRSLTDAGACVTSERAADRSAQAIAAALEAASADLVLLLGGTGSGANDHAIQALRLCGEVHVHGIALEPGRTAAIATVAKTPVIALPALFEQAFGVWLGLVEPALDRLTLRHPREPHRRVLTQKISSRVGLAEVALLRRDNGAFTPVAVSELPLQCLCAATHAMIIPASGEGHGAGEQIAAFALAGAE